MRTWKSGDVALVSISTSTPFPGIRTISGSWATEEGYYSDERVDALRKAVVIDPEDREQVETLRTLLASQPLTQNVATEAMQAALREFADPKPPRPEEPGTWGVVEASCCHSDQRGKWIRHEDGNWWPAENYGTAVRRSEVGRDPRLPDDWADLIDPVIVREGVQA